MELKVGYKQTEVGVIPEDWQVKTMAETGEIIIGLTYSPKDVKEYGHLVLRSSNIQNNKLAFENNVFVEMELPKRVIVKENDILICVRNGSKQLIGKCALIDKATEGSAFGAFMSVYRTAYAKYIFHQFQSNVIQKQIDEVMGATINQLTNKNLASFKIPFPKKEAEKVAIANALSDIVELISQTEKLIEKKKEIKQGVMQELLKPKEGWVTKKLGEIGEISGAGVDKKIVIGETPVRLLNYMDVYKRNFIYSNELNHWVTASNNKIIGCSVKKGDVFFTPSSETRNDIGLAAIAMEDIDDAVYSYHLMRFRININWDLKFKAYIFQTKNFLDQTEKMCEGGGKRYVLTMPKFRALEITFPESKLEQQEISLILWDIDNQLQFIKKKLMKLKLQKQGMMQALLTGKIRLI